MPTYQNVIDIPDVAVGDSTHIQKACPQLQNIQLKTLPLKDVPHFDINNKAIFTLTGSVDTQEDMNDAFFSNASLFRDYTPDITPPADDIEKTVPNLSAVFFINSTGGSTSISVSYTHLTLPTKA